MKQRVRTSAVSLLVLAAGACGAVWSSQKANPIFDRASLSEVLYIPSAKTVKALSLGYTGLMADIYWTRVVQYFGNKHLQRPESYKLLAPLLDIAITLDPKLDVAYEFGAFFLAQKPPEGAGEPDKAVELVKKGITANPEKWRLYYNLAYIYWLEKKDSKSAAEAFEAGSRAPGALPWMKVMAASVAQDANDTATARKLWTHILNDSTNTSIRSNAQRRLMCLDSDERVAAIQQRVDIYRQRTGRVPTFRDLIASGLLRGYPRDPAGNPYRINEYGEVVIQDPASLPFATRGLPHRQQSKVLGESYITPKPDSKQGMAPASPRGPAQN